MIKSFSYQLVSNSPWPITTSISLFSLLLSFILITNNKLGGEFIFINSLIALSLSLFLWFKDIIIEGTFRGEHTEKVQKGLTLGFILFVISEVCVFFSLFFAYFYNSLIPSIEIGSLWPPVGLISLDYKSVPLLNTLILLCSGFTITVCHNYIINGYKLYSKAYFYLFLTILLGCIFSYLQYYEYYNSLFTLTDSIFGTSFFILTGCHALHILIGTGMLIISLIRLNFSHFTNNHHLLFSFSAIYWHFVDAVWLVLFIVLYCWTIG